MRRISVQMSVSYVRLLISSFRNICSMHSTISVAEGIREYARKGYSYRFEELYSYPSRWRYDILRALDYFRLAGVGYYPRMDDAVQVLFKKRRTDNRWPLQAKNIPGKRISTWRKPGNRAAGTPCGHYEYSGISGLQRRVFK